MITLYTVCLNVIPLTAMCITPGPQFCDWHQNCANAVQTQGKLLPPSRGPRVSLCDRDMVGSITPFRDRRITKGSPTGLGLHRYSGKNYLVSTASRSQWAGERNSGLDLQLMNSGSSHEGITNLLAWYKPQRDRSLYSIRDISNSETGCDWRDHLWGRNKKGIVGTLCVE